MCVGGGWGGSKYGCGFSIGLYNSSLIHSMRGETMLLLFTLALGAKQPTV